MSYPTLYGVTGRKWTLRTSILRNGAWTPTMLTSYEVAGVSNGKAAIKTVMMDKDGKELPTNAIFNQFPRNEPVLQPFKFWLPDGHVLLTERRENGQCPLGAFDCWYTEHHDVGRRESRVQTWASIAWPGLIVRELSRWLSDELDPKSGQVLKTHEIQELKELIAFSG